MHRQVLQDALLDVLEPRVIGVEPLGDVIDVVSGLRAAVPRQIGDPLQIGADHVGFCALGARRFQSLELAIGDLAHLFGKVGVRQTSGDPAALVVVVVTELAPDGTELLAKDGFALLLPELLSYVPVDLRLQLSERLGPRQKLDDPSQALRYGGRAEQLQRVGRLQEQACGDAVGEQPRIVIDGRKLVERSSGALDRGFHLGEQCIGK